MAPCTVWMDSALRLYNPYEAVEKTSLEMKGDKNYGSGQQKHLGRR